jgi:predicted CopG family antitoxin
VAKTKTVAVSERVWQQLKEVMKREGASSMAEVIATLIATSSGVGESRFGVHKKLKVKFTQLEHEEIVKDLH